MAIAFNDVYQYQTSCIPKDYQVQKVVKIGVDITMVGSGKNEVLNWFRKNLLWNQKVSN